MTKITSIEWGKTPDNSDIQLFTLRNKNGVEAKITNYGAAVTSLLVPDRDGRFDDVVLGYDNLDRYLENIGNPHFGAIIGRYGNRISNGRFELDDKTYQIPLGKGPYSLHGGVNGFDKHAWSAVVVEGADGEALQFTYLSKDGEEGFPGNLTVVVTYALSDENGLKIDYTAHTDAPTVLNLTNHSYFNLAGAGSGDILAHEIRIDADRFTRTNEISIPTGELAGVANTPLDFRESTAIGLRIDDPYDQIQLAHGYDNNYILNSNTPENPCARVVDPSTGRVMDVWTTQPAMQFYTANALTGQTIGKGGKPYGRRSALCLETQHYPDSPNQPTFPTTILRPGETFHQSTEYRFSTV